MRNKNLQMEIRETLNDEEEKFFPFATKGNIRYLKKNMTKKYYYYYYYGYKCGQKGNIAVG